MGDRLFRIPEAGELLGLGKAQTYTWIKRGWIKTVKLPSGTQRIAESEIERIIKEAGKES